jgi:group II intron reverse transcriptase/maturase
MLKEMSQMFLQELNESEPLMRCRNKQDGTGNPGSLVSLGISAGVSWRRPVSGPALRRQELQEGLCAEPAKPAGDANRKGASGAPREAESRKAQAGGGWGRMSIEVPAMGMEQRTPQNSRQGEWQPEEGRTKSLHAKSQSITKWQVWEAWKRVKTGGKGTGVDNLSIAEVDANPKKYLYPLWNRMASGSYMPSPVREVSIPKGEGKLRKLGIPTVLDRVAQEVIRAELEPLAERKFHPSSFGYRPGKSAHQALEQCAQNCWQRWYVVDLDIKGFFDNLHHERMMSLLREYTQRRHVLVYVERWLKAGVVKADGKREERTKGTPQGGVISPLLANLYLHEVFDTWLHKTQPRVAFERYADDLVIHTCSMKQSAFILDKVRERLARNYLELNDEKTKTVYCWRTARFYKETPEIPVSFDFLGYTFRPRRCKRSDGAVFWGYRPAISRKSEKRIGSELRKLAFQRWSTLSIQDLSRYLQPRIRGWVNYFGRFMPSMLSRIFWILNKRLIQWARWKYKLRTFAKGFGWLKRVGQNTPELFEHWKFGYGC